jgi:aspartate aminotransferase
MSERWITKRLRGIDASGIRKVFDLAANMAMPVNLSIGQPHFDTPQPIKAAIEEAVRAGRNAYSPSQGIAPLIELIQRDVDERYGHADRRVFVTSGTSGGLMLALMTLVDPGDEVLVFDPYFVMYKHLVTAAGGRCVLIDTYPDFRIDLDKVRAAITDRTKVIIANSPSNPTGRVATEAELRGLAELAAEKDVALLSDEIYRAFVYQRSEVRGQRSGGDTTSSPQPSTLDTQPGSFTSPASFNDQTIVIDGFSKSHSMTGLRLGWCHGPRHVVEQMIKLQQFTFVCAPHPVQWGGVAAWKHDVSAHVAEYRGKRDYVRDRLGDRFEFHGADGAFYAFLPAPWGTGTEFVKRAIENELLIIPGNVFSERDTHFRISYAAEPEVLERGTEILLRIADEGA